VDGRCSWPASFLDNYDLVNDIDSTDFEYHQHDNRRSIDLDVFIHQLDDRSIGIYDEHCGPILGRREERIWKLGIGQHRIVACAHRNVGDSAARVRSDGRALWETFACRPTQETMTALATFDPSAPTKPGATTDPRSPEVESSTQLKALEDVPPLSPRMQLIRAPIVVLLVLSATLFIQIVLVSRPQESAAQQRAFDRFRSQLARGTAPIGPTDSDNRELPIGTSVAYLEIPDIGVKQVVGEGTTPGALFKGPGHRRDTPLPGQVGTCVLFGRRAAFGAPFARIDELKMGDLIKVTTGQGIFNFHVLGVREEGDPVPASLANGAARLVLTTAAGAPFLPNGVIRVDADLDGVAVVGPARLVRFAGLPTEERLMASDARTLWALALWLQALIVLSLGAVWVWHRWGRAQAWVIFLPALVLVGMFASGEAAHLLPNLL
jgi:sortase A